MSADPANSSAPGSISNILEFDRISFTYPCSFEPSIHSLTLNLPLGFRCGLIGENGCGKTTLFLLANGLLRPQRGQIRWRSQPIGYGRKELAELRQRIGLVFQNPEHQLVATTVAEDLAYGLVNLGLEESEIRHRIETVAEWFDLGDLLNQPVHRLSLGQKKQLSLADVMVLEPELLLLDEPTAYLSPGHCRDLRRQLQGIHAAGTTIVVATHDLEFLQSWANWLLVMDRGQLVMQGPPTELFRQQLRLEELNLGIPPTLELLAHWRQLAEDQLPLRQAELDALEKQLLSRTELLPTSSSITASTNGRTNP
ncbi:energy-coupling factor ABC transporter ATP-binding protein [Synechococcus sp. EJ6-Ellesmere]|uniref:energy-coupling factor ABC transporter ATP-binding protein n=1 Tax=Synechococcus sp. EJ6-Ellesmere TaxID=2823734 RepID=UPI0020CF71E4|nr:ABC transporter ATP-binding protein [Synechococcus sp. EJ6-Ellesmere]MCP9825570.1 ABC transporter ATP-binding protein [Synechococcus sp. EJ6-Ellesmere]